MKKTTTFEIKTQNRKFTLKELRDFVGGLPENLADSTEVGVSSYDDQRDGYSATIKISLEEGE